MYLYRKGKNNFISINQPHSGDPVKILPPGVVYYEYNNENVRSYQHMISDIGFLNDFKESVEGVFSNQDQNLDVIGINRGHGPFKTLEDLQEKYKVHVLGLGDVGGMMLTGFRLLGKDVLSEIGIFDLDSNKIKRFEYEINQIKSADEHDYPEVKGISKEALFDCDVFIFTASKGIPEVGSKVKDIRMYQLENNAGIIKSYVEEAVKANFKGTFMVVSDPVDLLCERVLHYSQGGLLPEQIKGFGLGVMAARASYYAKKEGLTHFDEVGRVYGPHGKALIVANDVFNYDESLSLLLSKKTVEANLDVRDVGYKPFIAPALSSAALSIMDCLRGKNHFSTIFIEGVYFGCKNKQIYKHIYKAESHPLADELLRKMKKTYEELKSFES